jgi:hypothetical protein
VISADPIDDLTSNPLIRSEPLREGNKGAARDNAGGHALFRFERPDSTDPAGRRPYRTLSGLDDPGEEFAFPRKFWPDTFIKPLRILPDTKLEIDSAGEIRPARCRDRAQSHYPAGIMGRVPQRGN